MATTSISIPVDGTPVDISALGTQKSFNVTGPFSGIIVLEISQDGLVYDSVAQVIQAESPVEKNFVALFARITRISLNTNNPGAPLAFLSAPTVTRTATNKAITVPTENTAGPPTDISEYGEFKTFVIGGDLKADQIALDVSNDGAFSPIASFSGVDGSPITLAGFWKKVRARVIGYQSGTGSLQVAGLPDSIIDSAAANLWAPPASPDEHDDEFDSDTLDSEWEVLNGTSNSNVSPLITGVTAYDTTFTSGVPRMSINPTTRPSWLLIQGPANNDTFFLNQLYGGAFPENLVVMARCRISQPRVGSIPDDDGDLGLVLGASSGGTFDRDNWVEMALNEQDAGTVQAEFRRNQGGVNSSVNVTTDVNFNGQALEYVAIHKRGTTYYGWVCTSAGNWICMRSTTLSFTPDRYGFTFQNSDVQSDLGPPIVGIDSIRFYETDQFIF